LTLLSREGLGSNHAKVMCNKVRVWKPGILGCYSNDSFKVNEGKNCFEKELVCWDILGFASSFKRKKEDNEEERRSNLHQK